MAPVNKIVLSEINDSTMHERVIVSLTSIKSRERALRETLEALVTQDLAKRYEVRLYLSHEPYMLDEGYSEAPIWIKELLTRNQLCKVSVNFVSNTGPFRKLLPILAECLNDGMNTVIVTCDDDTYYPPHWLRTLLHFHRLTGGIVAYRGHAISVNESPVELRTYSEWQRNPGKRNHSLENLPTGKDGIVYRPSYFAKAVLNTESAMELAPTADDLWFRWHTIARGVPCYLISLDDRVFDDAPSFEKNTSLWEAYNKKSGNDRTVAALEHYFQRTLGFTIAETLSCYRLSVAKKSIVPFSTARSSPALLAARQVQTLEQLRAAPNSLRATSARTHDIARMCLKYGASQPDYNLEPNGDRGGLLYARQTVDRFDGVYGWMSHKVKEKPLISVIMTTFNCQETVQWAAKSILKQDYPRLELVIVDDSSTDGTGAVLRKISEADERVRIVLLNRNRGTYFAKNVGLLRARGEVVTFHDADDWAHPARLRLQWWRLSTSDAVATRCNYVRHHAKNNQLVKVNGRIESPGFITLMTRREVFQQDGYFDCSRRAADDELICRLRVLHGEEAIDTFPLPLYVALYSNQSLIADSSEYSASRGISFQPKEDREMYKNAYTAWHDKLRVAPELKLEYIFPPKRIFIEKLQGLRAFEIHEIPDLSVEIGVDEITSWTQA